MSVLPNYPNIIQFHLVLLLIFIYSLLTGLLIMNHLLHTTVFVSSQHEGSMVLFFAVVVVPIESLYGSQRAEQSEAFPMG